MPEANSSPIQEKPTLDEVHRIIADFDASYPAADARAAVEAIGVATSGKGSAQWSQAIQRQLEALSDPDVYVVRKHLRSLQTEHLHAHVLTDRPLEPVLKTLQFAMSIQAPAGTSKTGRPVDWPALIRSSRAQSLLGELYSDVPSRFPREFAVARAARRLVDRGFVIEQNGATLAMPQPDHDRLVGQLELLVGQLGGLDVLRELFKRAAPAFDPKFQRYFIVRNNRVHPRPDLQFPFGFLIALAAKHLKRSTVRNAPLTSMEDLFGLATDYAALHDVQDYLPPIFENVSAGELPELLARRALFDSFFLFPQLRSTDVLRILRPLLTEIPPDCKYGPGWTKEDLFTVIERVYCAVGDRNGPVVLDAKYIASNVAGVDPAVAKAILWDVLAHPPEGPNQQFSRPTDRSLRKVDPHQSPGNNLHLRPLLRLDAKRMVLLDRSLSGPAMIEAVLTALRKPEGNAFQDRVIGPGTEKLLLGLLVEHGIKVHTGDYDVGSIHGECDLVVDEPGRLVFLESKAKPLTRNASAGSDVDVMLSLAGSVIAGNEQALGHEVELRKAGKLVLVEKETGATHTLNWNDQSVDRIALALFDYGVFQDRTAVKKLLWQSLNASYAAVDPQTQKDFKGQFKKLNENLSDLRDHVREWNQLTEGEDAFFNSWFLSVPQLMVMLDGVTGPEEFLNRLKFHRTLTHQTYDFYYEFKLGEQLRSRMLAAKFSSDPAEKSSSTSDQVNG